MLLSEMGSEELAILGSLSASWKDEKELVCRKSNDAIDKPLLDIVVLMNYELGSPHPIVIYQGCS